MTIDTCVNGDSLQWMQNYTGDRFADLVFADPPFNIDWKYDVYIDKMADNQFLDWNRSWIKLVVDKCLKHAGTICICMGDEYIADIDVICRRELGLTRQNWMIWHYGFGQSGKLHHRKRFTRSKTHILRYTQHPDHFTFRPQEVAVPSKRQLLYNDTRADSRGKCPDDVFIYKRIAGTHKERFPHMSTQMPLELVEVWIKAMTYPDDMIFDPFPGSGVSLAAARKLGRHYLGCELSPDYTNRILNRLATVVQLPHNNNLSADHQVLPPH